MSDSRFLITTLFFIILVFTMVTIAHGIALVVRGDQASIDDTIDIYPDDPDTDRDENEGNYSEFDVSDPLQVAGALFLGLELPMPFPIIITAFNAVCIGTSIYIVSEMIRKWIPLISS